VYLQGNNLWDAETTLLYSGTWKWTKKKKQESLLHIRKIIGDGMYISLLLVKDW